MRQRAPSAEERAAILAWLGARGVPPGEAGDGIRVAELERHEVVIRPGDRPDLAGVVLAGVLREYYLLESGEERTRAFATRFHPFGSLADALAGRPARVTVRAEVDSVVIVLKVPELIARARRSLAWERLKAGLVEQLYQVKSLREYELLALDAAARYRALREARPELERLVPLQQVASYLGITPVHLSRLRRRAALTGAAQRGTARRPR